MRNMHCVLALLCLVGASCGEDGKPFRLRVVGVDGKPIEGASVEAVFPFFASQAKTDRLNGIEQGWVDGRKTLVTNDQGEVVFLGPLMYQMLHAHVSKEKYRPRKMVLGQPGNGRNVEINVHVDQRDGVGWYTMVLFETSDPPELTGFKYSLELPVDGNARLDLLSGKVIETGNMKIQVSLPEKRVPEDSKPGWYVDVSIAAGEALGALRWFRNGPGLRETWFSCHGLGLAGAKKVKEVSNVGVPGDGAQASRDAWAICEIDRPEKRYAKFIIGFGLVPDVDEGGDGPPKTVRVTMWGFINAHGDNDLFVPDEDYSNVDWPDP